ncbi:LuxR family transcriptional regulator [Nocardioides gansuensis]|uniref:LuxR family transcriptional regulator n=1 Tax=Nocardioides gansuensis TaxID=2138300 RepID=A0A2T8F4R2_9ACTN|nr:LuxR C-terminal-related transcriptional regulator [Nocardioides gansuensis]PVG80706.1 LuxR family transcriptional regulator [Nocardioides gansuensis]
MATRNEAGNLPAELSTFVGRRQELLDVRHLLTQSRLVTLTGAGGIGKSRLALRVASEVRRSFPDGVWLVELASVSDPSLVPETIAGTLRGPDRSVRDPVEALTTFLAERDLLLVIDNCEQVMTACAPLTATLLRHAPAVRILATSREVMGVPGEQVYRLDPLPVPAPGDPAAGASAYPSVSLFTERAAAVVNGFTLSTENADAVMELCRRLDGMPLAIELAAGYVRLLSPVQILRRLDDRFRLLSGRGGAAHPRQRSLRATVEWSYDLCSPAERQMWNRLSVFAGDFDLAAAVAVCAGDGLEEPDVVEAVADLVAKSVLVSETHTEGVRFRFLETIREYGVHALHEADDSDGHALSEFELRSRHLDWYLRLAEELDRDWFGPRQRQWLERLRAELPNIRAALSFAAEHPEHARRGLRLAGSLGFFWRVAAMREGHTWLSRLLAADPAPTRERTRALLAIAWMMASRGQGRVEEANEGEQLARQVDPELLPRALLLLGTLKLQEGDPTGMPMLEESVDLARHLGRDSETAYAVFGLGWALGLAGEPAAAQPWFDECVATCRRSGEHWWRGVVQLRRALVGWMHGDLDGTASAAADALRASRVVPDLLACADAINLIGALEVGRDDRRAAYLLGAADQYWRDAGGSVVHTAPWESLLDERMAECREMLGEAAFDAEFRHGKNDPLEDAIGNALGERTTPTVPQARGGQAFGLTPREHEIAGLVAHGLTNREIADKLVISTRTAETHVQNILAKTGFTTRSQVAAWYAELAWD